MVVSSKFIKWRDNVYLPVGSKIRGLVIYKNFLSNCDGRFQKLPKSIFYSWVRDHIDGVKEGKDDRGIWFMIGDERESNTISHFVFLNATSIEFANWFSKAYDEWLHSKISSSELRQRFFNEATSGRESVVVNNKNIHLSKQMFNKWLELGAKRFNLQILTGRDSVGKWIIMM
jgi:hypothetical protein